MFLSESGRRTLLAATAIVTLSACAAGPETGSPRTVYRVSWKAARASDHVSLSTASTLVAAGGSATVNTESRHPAENSPAFPSFTVRLYRTNSPGVVQVVSRANLLETIRNKKGKLKIAKRNIGALLPMRPGETLPTNLPGDAVELTVRLERANQ